MPHGMTLFLNTIQLELFATPRGGRMVATQMRWFFGKKDISGPVRV